MSPQMNQALQSTAWTGAVMRVLLVTSLPAGLWIALGRAGRRGSARIVPAMVVAVILIGWLSTAWILSASGVFASAGIRILLPVILLAAFALIVLMRSKSITAAVDVAPLWWLVAFQSFRIIGFLFVWLWAGRLLPGSFALPAGIGDTLTGVFAIGTAVALRREVPWARRAAYAVNLFGLADLIVAVSMAAVSVVASRGGMSPMLSYPLSIVPTFAVPLAAIVHCLSLWQLGRRSREDRKADVFGGQRWRGAQA